MRKILILDDDPDIAFVVKTILEMHGFESDYIITFKDLENKLITYSPDLLILDISLDGADGRDLCMKIKLDTTTPSIPIVLFSANRNASEDFKNYRADAFVSKPFDSKNLIEMVNSLLATAA